MKGFALFVSSFIFGIAHQYQGITGLIGAFKTGLISGLMYLAAGRNLWLSIIAQGVYGTLGFIILFTG